MLLRKILFITQDFPPAIGGIQTYSEFLALSLTKNLEELHVLAPSQKGDHHFDSKQPYLIHRHFFSSNVMRMTVCPHIIYLCRKYNIQTILTSGWYTAAAALIVRNLGIVRHVYTAAHGQEMINDIGPLFTKNLYQKHRKWVFSNIDCSFPVSHYTGGLITNLSVPENKICIVPNGADISGWDSLRINVTCKHFRSKYSIPEGAIILATVARLVSRKGVDTVLKAMPAILQSFGNVFYIIAGDGPEKNALIQLAQHLGVTDHCLFIGRVEKDEIAALYKSMAIFVMPVKEEFPSVEGFGLVFREAHVFSKPVVGTYCGGIPDAIQDGETGLLIPPDNPRELFDAVVKLLSNPDFAEQLGIKGRQIVENKGGWDQVAERMLTVIRPTNTSP